jgi:hypothetical protein
MVDGPFQVARQDERVYVLADLVGGAVPSASFADKGKSDENGHGQVLQYV